MVNMDIKEVLINDIKVLENSRVSIKNLEGLMQDIKQHGLKHAIGVIPTKNNEYLLVFGHRRLLACKKLGWKKIPASLYDSSMSVPDIRINNLAENLHREDISPVELGRICYQLKTELGLNESEIHAKLSIPRDRIVNALEIFRGLPKQHRNKVAYVGGGNVRNGAIPAAVAHKIISCKRQFGLSEASIEKLFSVAQKEELTQAELYVISLFLEQGLSVNEAIKAGEKNKFMRADIIVNKDDIESYMNKYKIDSGPSLISAIIYGDIPPLKRPDFLNKKVEAKD